MSQYALILELLVYQSGSPGNKLHLELQTTQTCYNALFNH